MACRPVSLDRDHLPAPQRCEQLHEYRRVVVGHETQARLLPTLAQEALESGVLFWGHEHMQGSAIRAQQPAGQVPVAQMRGGSDKAPWGCQCGLQMLEAVHAVHIALLHGMGSAVERQQVSKDVRKILKHGVRLALDLHVAGGREHVYQIASDSGVFSRHAMAQDYCYGAGHPQTHRARQAWRAHGNQAIECQPVIHVSIPLWRRVGGAYRSNRSIRIRSMLCYQSSAYACYGVFSLPLPSGGFLKRSVS